MQERDIMNANGVLHVIDGVLVPRERRQAAQTHSNRISHGSSSSSHSSSSGGTYQTGYGRYRPMAWSFARRLEHFFIQKS